MFPLEKVKGQGTGELHQGVLAGQIEIEPGVNLWKFDGEEGGKKGVLKRVAVEARLYQG